MPPHHVRKLAASLRQKLFHPQVNDVFLASVAGRCHVEHVHSVAFMSNGWVPPSRCSRPSNVDVNVTKPWNQDFVKRIHSRGYAMATPSSNGRKALFVDTLALVRRLEAEGLSAKQAEAITHIITEVLHESLETTTDTFISKTEIQKSELLAEAALSKFKTEIQSSHDLKFAGLQREVEGLKIDVDKVKNEIRYEIDKVTAGQRLDLNLERGRQKEELNLHAQETSNLSNKLDREINSLKAQLEAAKFDVIRYCIGTLVSISAVGLGLLRIIM